MQEARVKPRDCSPVDYYHNTAGDIALSMNNEICYNVIRDAGIRAELLLALLSGHENPEPNTLLVRSEDTTAAGSPAAFLSSRLTYSFDAYGQEICSVQADGEEIGVMMGWEKGISEFMQYSHVLFNLLRVTV